MPTKARSARATGGSVILVGCMGGAPSISPSSLVACEEGMPGSALRALAGRCSLMTCFKICRAHVKRVSFPNLPWRSQWSACYPTGRCATPCSRSLPHLVHCGRGDGAQHAPHHLLISPPQQHEGHSCRDCPLGLQRDIAGGHAVLFGDGKAFRGCLHPMPQRHLLTQIAQKARNISQMSPVLSYAYGCRKRVRSGLRTKSLTSPRIRVIALSGGATP
jgi:hypothetical protein